MYEFYFSDLAQVLPYQHLIWITIPSTLRPRDGPIVPLSPTSG